MPYRRRTRRYSGSRRRRANYEWARVLYNQAPGSGIYLRDLLQEYKLASGADYSDFTIIRIRGYLQPFNADDTTGFVRGRFGVFVGREDLDRTDQQWSPDFNANGNWMAWLPWGAYYNTTPTAYSATWNFNASQWAVDIKSSRRIERVGETLWLAANLPPTSGYNADLSILMKKP